jgi:class 3 adenylate cyclase
VTDLDLDVRVGLHSGECEVHGGKLAGIAVHVGSRVASVASQGEALVSQTVKDLVAGSGIEFRDRGSRELRAFPASGASKQWCAPVPNSSVADRPWTASSGSPFFCFRFKLGG